ncbi:MAG: ice-binding family protein [Pseudomonadota bacterium]
MKKLDGYFRALPWLMAMFLGVLVAACGGGGGGGQASPTLLAVAVTPSVVSVPSSAMQAFVATATYSDGSTRDVTATASWTSGTTAVSTIVQTTGVATSVASGTSTITASFDGKTGSAGLTVTSATLVSIAVTPALTAVPINGVQPFVATATYSDGSTRNVTAFTGWTSSAASVGTVASTTGVLTGISSGTSVITANFFGKTSSVSLTVTAATLMSVSVTPLTGSVPMGGIQRYVATATFSDGTTLDVTAFSGWTSGTTATGTVVQNTGVTTGVAAGTSVITANYFGKTGTSTLTVSSATLVSVAVTPATAVVPVGSTQALLAKGTYSDGSIIDITTTAVWTSGTPLVASVLANTGVASGVSAGSASITASYGGKSGSASLTVPGATLVSIAVTPATATLAIGSTQAFVATGTYSDGTAVNISSTAAWTSASPLVATVVSATGVTTGVSAGAATITATIGSKAGSANLTVSTTANNGPAAVNLGSAGSFVVLAKTGISTTGATSIVGDLGVSPAAASFITGFGLIADATNTFSTSSLVTGKIYAANYAAPTPATMTSAIGSMQTAFTDAAGRSNPDFTELHAGDLSGKTLVPGVYKWGTGVMVNGSVTLSGGPNAVWIFQIAQDLTVGSGAAVTLSGGAQAQNVFWQVSGKATLGTTANFQGTLMSQTLISVGTGASVTGRLLAQTAVTLDAARVAAQ